MPRKKTGPLRKGDRVVATVDLRDVPEGTTGKIMLVNGLGAWIRSWVRFDNGIWLGSISNDKLVRAAEWPEFQVRRAEEAERKANAPAEPEPAAVAAAAAPAAEGAAPASGEASKVPAHLLARSKAARERRAAAGASSE